MEMGCFCQRSSFLHFLPNNILLYQHDLLLSLPLWTAKAHKPKVPNKGKWMLSIIFPFHIQPCYTCAHTHTLDQMLLVVEVSDSLKWWHYDLRNVVNSWGAFTQAVICNSEAMKSQSFFRWCDLGMSSDATKLRDTSIMFKTEVEHLQHG